ncbi:hypothetical protein ACFSMW_18895 [Virgibacillus halophilus]
MNIDKNRVKRWVNHFNTEGTKGLEEKRRCKLFCKDASMKLPYRR